MSASSRIQEQLQSYIENKLEECMPKGFMETKIEDVIKNELRFTETSGLRSILSDLTSYTFDMAMSHPPVPERITASEMSWTVSPISTGVNRSFSSSSQIFRSNSVKKGSKKDHHSSGSPILPAKKNRYDTRQPSMERGMPRRVDSEHRTGSAAEKKLYVATQKVSQEIRVSMGGPELKETSAAEHMQYKVTQQPLPGKKMPKGGLENKAVEKNQPSPRRGGPELQENFAADDEKYKTKRQAENERRIPMGVPEIRKTTKQRSREKKMPMGGPELRESTTRKKSVLSTYGDKRVPKSSTSAPSKREVRRDRKNDDQKETRKQTALLIETAESITSKTHYEMLMLTPTCTEAEIKKSYRKLAMMYHPDRNRDGSGAEIFPYIQHAYDTLSDDIGRMCYDADLRRAQRNAEKK